MTLFHTLLMWLYQQHAKRVTDAHFRPAFCSSHLKCLCSPALGVQTYCCCEGWWQVSEWKPQSCTKWAHGAVAASPFIAAIMLHWNQRLSGNACSLSKGCIGREETENCGTYTPHCCWNNWTHATISWVGCFIVHIWSTSLWLKSPSCHLVNFGGVVFQMNLSFHNVKVSGFTSSEESLLTASDFHSLQKTIMFFSSWTFEEKLNHVMS